MDIDKYLADNRIYFLIISIFLLLRLPLLFTYGSFLTGDESVVYIMAKHKEANLFFYGQAYGGGHAIEAFISSLIFDISWPSQLIVKAIPLISSLLIILVSYRFLNKFFNNKIAIISSLLLLFSSAFLEPGFTANGYIETIFFALLSMYFFFEIYFNDKRTNLYLMLFGIISGIAYWSFETSLLFLLLYLLLFFIKDRLFFIKKEFFKWFIPFLIGSSPMIVILARNKLLNFKDIVTTNETNLLVHFFISLENLITKDLPSFFGLENVHNFIGRIPLTNWIVYLTFITSFIYLVILNKSNARSLIKKRRISQDSKELIFIFFIIIYLLVYSISSFAGVAPRYLLPIFPYAIFLISIFVVRLNNRVILISVTSIMIMIGLISHYELYKRDFVIDGIIKTNYNTLPKIISFLDENSIKHVYTTYFMQWRLIASTNEDMIATCDHLCPCRHRYPLYDEIVKGSNKFAYLFHNSSSFVNIMEGSFKNYNITYKKEKIDDKIIFYELSSPIRPDFIKKCGWMHGFR